MLIKTICRFRFEFIQKSMEAVEGTPLQIKLNLVYSCYHHEIVDRVKPFNSDSGIP